MRKNWILALAMLIVLWSTGEVAFDLVRGRPLEARDFIFAALGVAIAVGEWQKGHTQKTGA